MNTYTVTCDNCKKKVHRNKQFGEPGSRGEISVSMPLEVKDEDTPKAKVVPMYGADNHSYDLCGPKCLVEWANKLAASQVKK